MAVQMLLCFEPAFSPDAKFFFGGLHFVYPDAATITDIENDLEELERLDTGTGCTPLTPPTPPPAPPKKSHKPNPKPDTNPLNSPNHSHRPSPATLSRLPDIFPNISPFFHDEV